MLLEHDVPKLLTAKDVSEELESVLVVEKKLRSVHELVTVTTRSQSRRVPESTRCCCVVQRPNC